MTPEKVVDLTQILSLCQFLENGNQEVLGSNPGGGLIFSRTRNLFISLSSFQLMNALSASKWGSYKKNGIMNLINGRKKKADIFFLSIYNVWSIIAVIDWLNTQKSPSKDVSKQMS